MRAQFAEPLSAPPIAKKSNNSRGHTGREAVSERSEPAWLRCVDWFIPPNVDDLLALRRARTIVLTCVVCPLSVLLIVVARWLLIDDFGRPGAVISASVCLALLSPWLLKWTGSVRLAGMLPTVVATFIIGLVATINGGVLAPALVAAPILPLMAAFLVGSRAATLSAAVAVLGVLAFVGMHAAGIELPLKSTENDANLVRGVATAGTTLLVFLGSKVHERQRDEVDQRYRAVLRELYRSTVYDSLTGAFNRRYLRNHLAEALASARRHGDPLSLIAVDVDHFKRVNDTFGHDAGDAVLMETAARLVASIRTEDVLARSGGEEFIVVARTDLTGAREVAERMRTHLSATPVQLDGDRSVDITISAGCSTFSPDDSIDTALVRADARLYRAKRAGRNRVVAFGEAPLHILPSSQPATAAEVVPCKTVEITTKPQEATPAVVS